MDCRSQVGEFSNSIPLLIWLSILPILFPVIWVFTETLPIEKKYGMCLQINRKEKLKKYIKKRKKTGEEQGGTKDSGTVFFLQGGSFFIFELGL